ncbi:MAG: cyclopropane-fatty-acyl-phospholipid synthase family protein [Rhodospirillaceae bacterium]
MTDRDWGGIAAYYDNLSRFLEVAQRVGRGGGSAQNATHRFLTAATGEEVDTPGPERLDHIVLAAAEKCGVKRDPRVLDAGCGLGGTIFHWQGRMGGHYDGLTLSPEQARRASAAAQRRGIAGACRFHVRSYHDPIAGGYDAVIAIESLAHSADPAAAIANLGAALAPGGLFVIVDDMPEPKVRADLLHGFKKGWRCPVLLDRSGFAKAAASAGLEVVEEEDLTPRLRPRPLAWLRVLIGAFAVAQRLAPTQAARAVIGAFLGGFYLEALYRTGGMRYRLLVAKKR